MSQDEIEALLHFFKALADESRLKILGLLANQARSVEQLAAILELRGPTVSHHLSRLRQLGLVDLQPEGNVHRYSLNAEGLRQMSRELLPVERVAALVEDTDDAAWERKVLRDFIARGRLKEIPASRKKRAVILNWLADKFEKDRIYPEPEVNALIEKVHPDFATLRRELIGADLMAREAGKYWRVVDTAARKVEA